MFRQGAEFLTQMLGDRAHLAVTDAPPIDANYRSQLSHRAGAKHFVGSIELRERQIGDLVGHTVTASQFEHGGPRDALRAGHRARRTNHAVCDREQMRGVGLGHEAIYVEHDGIVRPCGVGFNLGEDRLQ